MVRGNTEQRNQGLNTTVKYRVGGGEETCLLCDAKESIVKTCMKV